MPSTAAQCRERYRAAVEARRAKEGCVATPTDMHHNFERDCTPIAFVSKSIVFLSLMPPKSPARSRTSMSQSSQPDLSQPVDVQPGTTSDTIPPPDAAASFMVQALAEIRSMTNKFTSAIRSTNRRDTLLHSLSNPRSIRTSKQLMAVSNILNDEGNPPDTNIQHANQFIDACIEQMKQVEKTKNWEEADNKLHGEIRKIFRDDEKKAEDIINDIEMAGLVNSRATSAAGGGAATAGNAGGVSTQMLKRARYICFSCGAPGHLATECTASPYQMMQRMMYSQQTAPIPNVPSMTQQSHAMFPSPMTQPIVNVAPR